MIYFRWLSILFQATKYKCNTFCPINVYGTSGTDSEAWCKFFFTAFDPFGVEFEDLIQWRWSAGCLLATLFKPCPYSCKGEDTHGSKTPSPKKYAGYVYASNNFSYIILLRHTFYWFCIYVQGAEHGAVAPFVPSSRSTLNVWQ